MKKFKETFVVFLTTALNFLFSYLLHFFLGRLLGPAEYGSYGVVTNIAWITGIPLGAIGVSIVKYTSIFYAKKQYDKISSLLKSFLRFSFILNVSFMIIYILLSNFLSEILGGGLTFLIVLLSVSFPFSGISGVILMFLQGTGKIYSYSFLNFLSTLSKLLIAIFLIFIGFGVFGALLSFSFSSIFILFLGLILVWKFFKRKKVDFNKKIIFKFGFSVLLTTFFINLILYFDLFFVNSILGSVQAGFYEAAVTLSRAFLMTLSILAVFFPDFNQDAVFSDNRSLRSNLSWALFYTGIICLIGLLFYWFFSGSIISLTYSDSYLQAIPLLKILSIGYTFYSLFNVLLYSLWAFNKQRVVGFFGFGLFIVDLFLLSIFVPLFGPIAAAWSTTILMMILFIFSLILVYSQLLR